MLRYLMAGMRCFTKPKMVKDTPIHIQIEPTTKCNLRCPSCRRIEVIKHPKNMSLEEFKTIIETIQPKKITLSGQGEPLLNSQITEMIKYAKSMGSSINMTTNGTLLKERAEEIFESGLDLFGVSIDAPDRESYIRIRGGDYFGSIIEGIKEIVNLKRRLNRKYPKIRTCFVIQGKNTEKLVEFIRLSSEIDADAILFQPLEFTGDNKTKNDLIGDMTYQDTKEKLKKALKVAKEVNIPTNLEGIIKGFEKHWNKLEFRQEIDRKCIFPWFSTYITVDGSLMVCCSLAYSDAILGNILKEDFYSVWNGPKYCKLREMFRKGKKPYQMCRACSPPNLVETIGMSRFTPGFIFFR